MSVTTRSRDRGRQLGWPGWRPAAVLLGTWIGLFGLLVAVGEIVVHSSAITDFDRRVTSTVVDHRSPALNDVMKAVTWMGSWVALVVAGGLLLALVLVRRLPVAAALLAVAAWAGEALGVWATKNIVTRHRPPEAIWLVHAHGWSFPSGHAATATLVFAVLALMVRQLTRRAAVQVAAWAVAGVAVVATAFSRVELGVHWTTDVIASVVVVSSWLLAIWLVLFRTRASPSG